MEEDEGTYRPPPEEIGEVGPLKHVLRSSCVGSQCLCASKGRKHHKAEQEDHHKKVSVSSTSSKMDSVDSSTPSLARRRQSNTSARSSATSKVYETSSSSRIMTTTTTTTHLRSESSSRVLTNSSISSLIRPESSPAPLVSGHSSSKGLTSSTSSSSHHYLSNSPVRRMDYSSLGGSLSHHGEKESSFKETHEDRSFSKDYSPDTSSFSDSLDSPRHRIFKDFTNWINSPRTGYTYAESETYGSETESKYEVPMPHMARKPIHRDVLKKSITVDSLKPTRRTSSKVKSQVRQTRLSVLKRLFRKVFYEFPASLLIFDTKLLLKSKDNVLVRTLLSLWTILVVTPFQYLSICASRLIHLPLSLGRFAAQMFGRGQQGEVEERITLTSKDYNNDAQKPPSRLNFKSLVHLRQSLAAASKRYRLNKLKEKENKSRVHKGPKRKSHGPPTRRSRRLRGIPAEKYELPKKWRRRLKKRRTAMNKVKVEDNHLLSDAWYSFLSLFSLSSYTDDDDDHKDESDSMSSDDESIPQRKISPLLRSSKPSRVFYVPALMLSYLRMPLDVVGSGYHDLRMGLAKRIYHLFDHTEEPDSDSSSSDDEENDENEEDDYEMDVEEFMDKRYLIQDIVTYLVSLGIPPPEARRTATKAARTSSSSYKVKKEAIPAQKSILKHKYKGRSADFSDSEDSEVEITYTNIRSSRKPTSSVLKEKVSRMFTFSKNGGSQSSGQEIKETPGIVLSSDEEEVVSVIQVPKLYSTKKSSSPMFSSTENKSSWKDLARATILYPWDLCLSSLRFLRNELNIWRTCGNRSSSSHGDGLLQRIGRSIYSVLRNSCLFIGSLCICASLPFIHVGKKVISLFSSRDEVDELHLEELMDGNDECIDEGFDSLSDEDFDEKVLQRNMKFFESSELLSTQSSKIDGKQKVGSCSKCVPLLLLFLLLVPLCLYGLLPTLHSSDGSLPVPLDWISIKSVDYLDTAKGLQNRAQEGGKTLLSYAQNEYNGISSSVSFKFSQLKDALSRSGSSLSVGLSGFEGSLRQYFSSFFNILCGFCTNLKNGLMNACTSSYECLRSFLAWIGDNALFCYKRTIGIIFLGKEKTSFFISNAWQSIGNKLFGLSLLFNKKRSEESLSSDPIEPSRQETTQHAPKKTTQENVSKPKVLSSTDYDIIVDKIISSEKFQELSHSKSLSEDDNVVIQSSKNEILKLVNDQEEKLQKEYSELKDILLQQKETLDSHQESYDLWKKDIENVFQSLKLEIQGLSTQDSSNSDGLLKELSDKIHALEENSQKLFNLSTSCCDSIKSLNVEDRVKGYFQGAKGDELIGQMKEQFITKEDNSDRLAKLKVEVLEQLKKLQSSASGSTTLEVDSIHRVVQEALIRYDADKTGKFDYALESAGGSVISTRCTETYVKKTALYTLLGLPLWYPSNNPRTAIQPGVHPGECWAFKGSEGFLVIHLSNAIVPKSFSIEHIPKSMSPSGSIDSAPKDFIVLGLKSEKDPNPAHLGKYSYSHTGDPLQSFDITDPVQESFDVIELNILSNHGNVNFTCLYRFRVHGSPIHD